MSEDKYKGYRDPGLAILKKHDVAVWDRIEIDTPKGIFSGLILPRSKTEDAEHIVIKMESGYNTGVHVDSIKSIKRIGHREGYYAIPEKEFPYDKRKKNVTLLGTGGTIASRLDYTTGAVVPAFSPGELYGAVPELADICNLSTVKLFGVFSENMGPEQYKILAEEIGKLIEKGVDGIVIGHGTDTMHHTASILSYMVQDTPVPIVIVGSQRSSDRPSSDAARNLLNAVSTAAHSNLAEIMVCMFGPTSDDYGLLHMGTRVRKMHSSYRSTFRTLSDIPIAMVWPDKIVPLREHKVRRNDREVKIHPHYDERVSILYYYPGMAPDMVDSLIDRGYHGIVIAGTGLGHVNSALNPALKRAVDKGIAVVMTVQTLWGYVHMNVYDTGRYLLELGVIPCENMLPEAAYMKLCWTLGQTRNLDEVRRIMLTPIANEITEREPHNGYLVYQGGIPEVERFLSTYKK
ncbi:MAG TPA: Glu-tRNA(Gln) amidotransferase subunit GatD [bacterium]|nr:MAG: L-asparaginase 1 [bacterium ADurb.Bin270]HPW45734.1 Glu-tRNA(Gln) amidotransferase subunit GatD [bacterium]HQC50321.1 Glu-tRNA(Gln) amidotransferase subunit GatD [bacterium]HQG12942.1 Glu-tRNA(Gln) amidotransferase subunit GatD [bacterium]HQH79834.1 Glu-tRNA(Gln) amidotransferase subunit GatD [bacterium]